MTRRFNLKTGNTTLPCPKCGQNTAFKARAERIAEDCCEVWVECICGHDPHKFGDRFGDRLEDVWGSLDRDTILMAIRCWNDAIKNNHLGATI